jgi:hypothetical protein
MHQGVTRVLTALCPVAMSIAASPRIGSYQMDSGRGSNDRMSTQESRADGNAPSIHCYERIRSSGKTKAEPVLQESTTTFETSRVVQWAASALIITAMQLSLGICISHAHQDPCHRRHSRPQIPTFISVRIRGAATNARLTNSARRASGVLPPNGLPLLPYRLPLRFSRPPSPTSSPLTPCPLVPGKQCA